MSRISSRQTFYFKRIFPLIWFALLAFFLSLGIRAGFARAPMFFITPMMMAAVSFWALRRFLWSVADEVIDLGDALRVRRGEQSELVALTNVARVEFAPGSPPRIVLHLCRPGRFGATIAFLAPQPLNFATPASNPVADALAARVARAAERRIR